MISFSKKKIFSLCLRFSFRKPQNNMASFFSYWSPTVPDVVALPKKEVEYKLITEELKSVVEQGKTDLLRSLVKEDKYGNVTFSPMVNVRYKNKEIPLWWYCIIMNQPDCFGVLLECGLDPIHMDFSISKTPLQGAMHLLTKHHKPRYMELIIQYRGIDILRETIMEIIDGKTVVSYKIGDKMKENHPELYADLLFRFGSSDTITSNDSDDLRKNQMFFF